MCRTRKGDQLRDSNFLVRWSRMTCYRNLTWECDCSCYGRDGYGGQILISSPQLRHSSRKRDRKSIGIGSIINETGSKSRTGTFQ